MTNTFTYFIIVAVYHKSAPITTKKPRFYRSKNACTPGAGVFLTFFAAIPVKYGCEHR